MQWKATFAAEPRSRGNLQAKGAYAAVDASPLSLGLCVVCLKQSIQPSVHGCMSQDAAETLPTEQVMGEAFMHAGRRSFGGAPQPPSGC